MNPAVTDAFALAITGAGGQPAYPGVPGHEPDAAAARREAETVDEVDGRNPQAPAARRLLCVGD